MVNQVGYASNQISYLMFGWLDRGVRVCFTRTTFFDLTGKHPFTCMGEGFQMLG